ncbi:MAG: hypothetical protein IJS32_01285 [Kiritimatiellae bacterium]|nr:hypothetical protein [Kiritimatiellia bacterium]
MKKFLPLLLVPPILSLFACVSAQEMRNRRAQEHPEWIAPLPQADQVRILNGQIAIGDPSGAVWIALGPPSRTAVTATAEATNVVWNYTETESYVVGTQTYVSYETVHHHHHRDEVVPVVHSVDQYADREVLRVSVSFADDRVVAISAAQ